MLIAIDRQLGRGRKLGRFIVAIRDGFIAEATTGRRAPPASIGLSDQSGEFCNRIVFSVGSETFVSHRICSDLVCARTLTRRSSTTTRQADADYQFQ
jgi:hypothetical protein